MKYTLILENLNCAHCAGKIEQAIAETDGYEKVSFNFATKELRFESEKKHPAAEIQQICDSIEDGVSVKETASKEKKKLTTEHILLIIALVFGAAAVVFHLAVHNEAADIAVLVLSLAATVLAGWKVFIKGFKNLIKFRIEETDIEKLSQIRPDTAIIIHHGHEEEVAAESVAVGETIVIKPHARVPIDGVVVDGRSTVDNAALTGESIPVAVAVDDEVLSGGINGDSLLKIRTTKAFGESTAARILQMVEDAAAQKGKSEKLISRFAAVYTPIMVGLAVLIAVVPPLVGLGTFSKWIYNALVVLVASCPCAIVISVPLAYFSGIGAASRQGVLIKGGKYLEALATAKNFVFDKTGTLTTGKLRVAKTVSLSDYSEDEILSLAGSRARFAAKQMPRTLL